MTKIINYEFVKPISRGFIMKKIAGSTTFFAILIFLFQNAYAEKVSVSLHGKPLTLSGKTIKLGESLPNISLPDSSMNLFSLRSLIGNVTIISVVPSIDTKVCEKQTHILSEENGGLTPPVRLVTVSRDLPFAQNRFAEEAKIENVMFLSDYREGIFGNSSGLMIQESRLLTRAIMVLDKKGMIRHLEIVPDLGQLPDMKKAFRVAKSLL